MPDQIIFTHETPEIVIRLLKFPCNIPSADDTQWGKQILPFRQYTGQIPLSFFQFALGFVDIFVLSELGSDSVSQSSSHERIH